MKQGRPLARWILLLGLILAGAWAGTEWMVLPWVVAGASMEPALAHGDRVFVDRWTYRQRLPRAGEVVLLHAPDGTPLVKRIVRRTRAEGQETRALFWVLGDKRSASTDSRSFGPVPAGRIRGRLTWRYWPLSRAGPVR